MLKINHLKIIKIEILFYLFTICNSDIHSHMPKHTPTQYYNIPDKDGMKLRSGTTINCAKTTELSKDSYNLIMISDKCTTAFNIAHSNHGNGTSDILGPEWISFFTEDFGKLIDNLVGGRFSIACTRLYATERYIAKWRNTINRYHSHDLKAVMCLKIEQAINQLDDMKKSRHEHMCGCSDLERKKDEETIMRFYHQERRTPGRVVINDHDGLLTWVTTPEISPEEFEREFYINQFMWRHDLRTLKDRFEAHLAYFRRVPHKTYQEAYFALASRKINQDCAKNILSYL